MWKDCNQRYVQYVCMGSIISSIFPHTTPHKHTIHSCTLAGVHKDVVIHMYIHTSELCDYRNIVVDIDTITALLCNEGKLRVNNLDKECVPITDLPEVLKSLLQFY